MKPNWYNFTIEKFVRDEVLAPLKKQWKLKSFSKTIWRLYLEWHYYKANYGHVPKGYLKQHNQLSKGEEENGES